MSNVTATKTKCSTSRDSFNSNALPMAVEIAGQPMLAEPRQFATGSMGWNATDKVTIKLANGDLVRCQVGLTITVIGSKELPPATLGGSSAATVE